MATRSERKSESILASAASIEPPKWVGAGTYESVPITAAVIERWGHFGHGFLKLAVFSIAWVYYDELPDLEELGEWYRLAIPLGFVIGGVILSLQNLHHILTV